MGGYTRKYPTQLGFLGCGSMGGAILAGLLKSKQMEPNQIWVSTRSSSQRLVEEWGVNDCSIDLLLQKCERIILAVKPQQLSNVVDALQRGLTTKHVVISLLAGTSVTTLEDELSPARILRTMPNLASHVEAGCTLLYQSKALSRDELIECETIFSTIGHVEWLAHEEDFHAATALSGCGPAFIALIAEALADTAVSRGLTRAVAQRLTAHTIMGTGELLKSLNPAILKDKVSSPHGVTIQGVLALEQAGVRGGVVKAMQAAIMRSEEMENSK